MAVGAPSLLPSEPVADRYELIERLGAGGSAVVYRAYDSLLRHEVALKLLHPERLSPGGRARLRREAAIAQQVSSPQLVRVFDIGSADSQPFLTMELVLGGSLRERLRAGPLPLPDVLRWGGQPLSGMSALHRHGAAHRDVKPGNLLLTHEGDAKLADLGLARRLDADETRATAHQAIVGTWDYLAPEQVAGHDGDARSDLYAAGVVFFEMLTGRLPFGDERTPAVLLLRLRARAPQVQRFRRGTPRWLRRFVRRLLEREPEQRYADATAALADFEAQRVRLALRPAALLRTAAVAAPLFIGGFWVVHQYQRPHFLRVAEDGDRGIVGLDTTGRPLWHLAGVTPDTAGSRIVPMRLAPGADPLLAVVLHRPGDNDPGRMLRLSFLDPDTGKVDHSEMLISGAEMFPDYPPRFHPELLLARDLDGDGVDELLITYYYESHAPSFTVLYEPTLHRSRLLFASPAGYHRIEETVDVDGDGRREAIFAGINNRMGWINTLAAVRIDPWVGEQPEFAGAVGVAVSPEKARSGRQPLWYALFPRGHYVSEPGRTLSVDSASRQLVVHYQAGDREARVGFDGYLAGTYTRPLPERRSHREAAYGHLRELRRLLAAGNGEGALVETRRGRAEAELSEDPLLAEVLGRFEGTALAAAGRLREAQRWFADLAGDSPNASDIALDAGVAFHAAGALDEARRWYERGIGRGGAEDAGQDKAAFLGGICLVLFEQGKYEEVELTAQRFVALYPMYADLAALYRELARWRSGERPDLAGWTVPATQGDLLRYLFLELRNAAGEPAAALLSEVRRERAQSVDSVGGLYSLEGEVLSRLGRQQEAATSQGRAIAWLGTHVHQDPDQRLLLMLARERKARLAAAGTSPPVPSASAS
jgi:serine/threonine-protein kinase